VNIKKIYLVYFILLELIVLFPGYASVISAGVILLNLLIGLSRKREADIAIVSSFLLPGEVFPMVSLLMLLFLKKITHMRASAPRVKKLNGFALSFVVCCSLLNALRYHTEINLFFYLIYLTAIMITAAFSFDILNVSVMLESMKQFIVIEFIVTVTIILKYSTVTPGDIFHGSMSSAHWFANWLIVVLILLLFHDASQNETGFSLKKLKQNKWYIFLAMIMLYLADAKSLIVALVAGILGYIIFEHKKRTTKYSFAIYMLSFYIGVFFIMLILYWAPVRSYIQAHSELMSTYLYMDGWNGKFNYIRGTFLNELNGIKFFTGYGLGQYGSRIANLFAYDVMWRADNGINNLIAAVFAPHHIPEYVKYIEFYDEYFVSQIGWRSAVLSYPFNSFTALIAETGVIGVILTAGVANSYVRNSYCKIIAYYFLAATFFDLYFDNYPCAALIILILTNTLISHGRNAKTVKTVKEGS